MALTLRPFEAADAATVDALHRAVDWPVRSAAGWTWLRANPARSADFPIGWLAEDDRPGRDGAAFVGQFPQRFWHGDEAVLGVTGYSIIVPPHLRGAAWALIRKVLAQPGALHYTLNANGLAAPLYRRHGMKPWPEQTHALKLAWIIDPLICASGRLLRGMGDSLRDEAGAERLMNRRLSGQGTLRLPGAVSRLTDIPDDDDDWALFWSRLRAGGGFIADRGPAVMRWRLGDPDRTLEPLLLVHRRDGAITGALTAMMGKMSRIDPPFLDIIDLVALDDDPDAVRVLTRTLLGNARRLGAAKVRLQVVSPALLRALGPLARRARREGGWGHAHARFDPVWSERIAGGWAPTPYDGDYGFCLRPVPVAGA